METKGRSLLAAATALAATNSAWREEMLKRCNEWRLSQEICSSSHLRRLWDYPESLYETTGRASLWWESLHPTPTEIELQVPQGQTDLRTSGADQALCLISASPALVKLYTRRNGNLSWKWPCHQGQGQQKSPAQKSVHPDNPRISLT